MRRRKTNHFTNNTTSDQTTSEEVNIDTSKKLPIRRDNTGWKLLFATTGVGAVILAAAGLIKNLNKDDAIPVKHKDGNHAAQGEEDNSAPQPLNLRRQIKANALYAELKKDIERALLTAEVEDKPLLVLLGENHEDPASMMIAFMTLTIIKDLQSSRVSLQMYVELGDGERKLLDEITKKNQLEFTTSAKLNSAIFGSLAAGGTVKPIDDIRFKEGFGHRSFLNKSYNRPITYNIRVNGKTLKFDPSKSELWEEIMLLARNKDMSRSVLKDQKNNPHKGGIVLVGGLHSQEVAYDLEHGLHGLESNYTVLSILATQQIPLRRKQQDSDPTSKTTVYDHAFDYLDSKNCKRYDTIGILSSQDIKPEIDSQLIDMVLEARRKSLSAEISR